MGIATPRHETSVQGSVSSQFLNLLMFISGSIYKNAYISIEPCERRAKVLSPSVCTYNLISRVPLITLRTSL